MRWILVVTLALGCGPGGQREASEPSEPAAPIPLASAPPEDSDHPREPPRVVAYTPRHVREPVVPQWTPSPPPAPRPPRPRPIAAPPAAAAAAPVSDESIRMLNQLIAATADKDPSKPDLLLRLAESHAGRARAAGLADRRAVEQRAAVKAYVRLTATPAFAGYARMDGALFSLATVLQQMQQLPEARKAFLRLIKDYPASTHIPEAYLAFADYYFDQAQMADAAQFYDKVLQFPSSRVHAYATLKRGYVFLNLSEHQRALEMFYKAHSTAMPRDVELAREARSGFVLAFAQIGKASVAHQAFTRVSAADAGGMLEDLVDLYANAGKAAEARFGYRELIRLRPTDAKICDWQVAATRMVLMAGTGEEKVTEALNLLKLAEHVNAPACTDQARALTGDLARAWHAEAMKTSSAETAGFADRLYQGYLAGFPAGPASAEMRYDHAELLWQIAQVDRNAITARPRWERAAASFEAVATDPDATPAHRATAVDAGGKARENLAALP